MKHLGQISALFIAMSVLGVSGASAQTIAFREGRPLRFADLRSLTNAAERESNTFRHIIEKREDQLDHRMDRYYGTTEWTANRDMFYDELKPNVQKLDESFERLRRDVDTGHPAAGRGDVRTIAEFASIVDKFLAAYPNGYGKPADYVYTIGPTMANRWSTLRAGINSLADFYDLPRVGVIERNSG